MLKIYAYDKCSTCRNAQKWLKAQGIDFEAIPIVSQPPSVAELTDYIQRSGKPLSKWFNTSGEKYRELGLKDRLPTMSDAEKIALLASDGKLMKRPVVVGDSGVSVGFDEQEYASLWAGEGK